jgi:hypothetical protein
LGIWVGFLKQPALPSEAPQIFFYHIQYLSKNFYYYINYIYLYPTSDFFEKAVRKMLNRMLKMGNHSLNHTLNHI